jgi:phenylpropionate dioxygenase-like ring-hydroxylating dioxygenase large terminal subunit
MTGRVDQDVELIGMKWHPSLGYFDEGLDLAAPQLFEAARRAFGQAKILHPVAYRSKAFADLEDEKVWTRAWVCIGTHQRIAQGGDLLPYTVGNHGIHVQRDGTGRLQGRFNKAQHGGCRAIPAQCQSGKKTKCSYTSCGYSRDRDVICAPELNQSSAAIGQYLGFNPAKLVPIKVETWGPLLFVNLDTEAGPLVEQFDGLTKQLGRRFGAEHRHVGRCDIEPTANWKLVGRNFLQPPCAATAGNIFYAPGGKTTADGYWQYVTAVPAGLMAATEGIPAFPAERATNGGATFCWVYPNLLLALLPNHTVSWTMQPTDLRTCLLRMDIFAHGPANGATIESERELLAYWTERTRHDTVDAEAVQKDLANRMLPDAATAMVSSDLPVERSYLAYCAQKYLIDCFLTEHRYYWNDSYTNPRLAVSASTPGAS